MFIPESLQVLKDNNQKLTKTRLWILEQLEHIKKPLNPYELLEQSTDKSIDISTIYRNLELFD
jgi:Fe2+ or Zn2+ uptake regulation protein